MLDYISTRIYILKRNKNRLKLKLNYCTLKLKLTEDLTSNIKWPKLLIKWVTIPDKRFLKSGGADLDEFIAVRISKSVNSWWKHSKTLWTKLADFMTVQRYSVSLLERSSVDSSIRKARRGCCSREWWKERVLSASSIEASSHGQIKQRTNAHWSSDGCVVD